VKEGKEQVRAVLDDDLAALLDRLGVLHDFNAGRFKCFHCRDELTAANLRAVFPDSGDVKGVCFKADCVFALTERTTVQ
jgi:hypothetical protein